MFGLCREILEPIQPPTRAIARAISPTRTRPPTNRRDELTCVEVSMVSLLPPLSLWSRSTLWPFSHLDQPFRGDPLCLRLEIHDDPVRQHGERHGIHVLE